MKGLFVKDFSLLFQQKRTFIILLFICVVSAFSMDSGYMIGYMCMVFGIIGAGTISYDEADNGFQFLFTLPVDSRTYVAEKYMFSLGLELAGGIIGCAAGALLSAVRGNSGNLSGGLMTILPLLPVISIMIMILIMIPVQLKYGAEKGRIVLLVISGSCAALPVIFSRSGGSGEQAQKIVDMLSSLSAGTVVAAILLFLAAATAVSAAISIKVLSNKEF